MHVEFGRDRDGDAALMELLGSEGYTHLRRLPSGEMAGLANYLYTCGLVVGLTRDSYRLRYCYETRSQAEQAIASWDGAGDPPGPWLKAKGLGVDRANPAAVAKPSKSVPRVTAVRPAGPGHQVVTVVGGKGGYRRRPCRGCPWRLSVTGAFPAEAFRHSAATAYDMSERTFSCHESGARKPAICAGFLLRGADHNLAVRLKRMKGEIRDDVDDDGAPLHESYREMAIANGVPEDDPAIANCR